VILNVQFNEAAGPGGTKMTAVDALQQMGPVVPIVLLPFGGRDGIQSKPGDPVTGFALVDTGARATCIDCKAAKDAGIPIVDTGTMSSATHHDEEVPIFAAKIEIQGFRPVDAPRAFGANLAPMGIVALIGRDVLKSSIMIYNGTTGQFSLTG